MRATWRLQTASLSVLDVTRDTSKNCICCRQVGSNGKQRVPCVCDKGPKPLPHNGSIKAHCQLQSGFTPNGAKRTFPKVRRKKPTDQTASMLRAGGVHDLRHEPQLAI
jgi:hypothetical protein